jgi:hypothetical protein
MPNELPLPPELRHLIEKRERTGRRNRSRRVKQDRRADDLGPLGSIESIADLEALPLEDRRLGRDRRKTHRRKSARRKSKSTVPKSGGPESLSE